MIPEISLINRWHEGSDSIALNFTTLNVDITLLEMHRYKRYRSEVTDTIALLDVLYDHPLQEGMPIERFTFMRYSTVTSFFAALMVDMPLCLHKSKSLFRQTFELPFFKMTNMIMRAGKRAQVLKYLSWSFAHSMHRLMPLLSPSEYLTWEDFYTYYMISAWSVKGCVTSAFIDGELDLVAYDQTVGRGLTDENPFVAKSFLFEKLADIAPTFSFSVRRVDKNVRKNSRGKSGKYMLLWKYIPPYRRIYNTLRWLIQDFKFQRARTFSARWIAALDLFLLAPHKSLIGRMRKFLHFWVFDNYKKTLLKTFRSTS